MKEFNRSLAVTIGINNYRNGIHPLETAKPDAEELARILEQDYHYNQVTLITDDTQIKPTRENLFTLLKTTLPQQNLTESDRLLFYFAGHGIARPSEEETEDGPQGFLVPADAHSDKSDSLIPMRDIYQYLAKLRCRHLLVILDCCFAGAFRWASTRKFIYTPKKATKAHYQRFTKFPAWEVITSSAYNQEALDFLNNRRIEQTKSEKHSPFAQALFQGLKGEADLNQDGAIIAPELYIYLRDYVEKNSKEKQTPGFFPLQKHDRGEYIFQIPGKDLNLAETPELNPDNNPYRGLKAYDEEHAHFFFGRQKLSQELFKIVSQSERQLTTVVGISGSGKSSLVKAGLIPNLRNIDIRLIYTYWLTLFVLKGYPHFPIQFLPINYIPNPFYIRLISACLLSLAILEVFPYFTLKYLPIYYTYQWQILEIIRPGAIPFPELFRTFAPLITEDISIEKFKDNPQKLVELINEWGKNNPQCKLLLVIDQFEELITQAPKEVSNQESQNKNRLNKIKSKLFGKQKETKSTSTEIQPEWQQFLVFLVKIIQNSPQLNIVVTLRSDFEPRFAESVLRPHWNRFIVRPMRPDELREVVESPATEMALYFEPANLVDRLVDEVNQTPGALPLLSFTLSELYIKLYEEWQSGIKSDRSLTVDREFDRQGGVAGSLTRRANEEYENLPDDAHRTTMRRLMLRMVEIEGQEALKRRVLKSELIYPSNEENERVKTVLKSLDDARLIVTGKDRGTGEPYYEPAHDFLVRGWDKLQIWIRQEQENLTLQRLLTPAAMEWNHIEQNPHKVEPLFNFWNMVLDFTYASINSIPTLFNKFRWWNSEEENQKSQKKSRFLWDTNPRLNLLEEVLNSNNNWLSQTETDFVESSIKRNHRKRATSWNITFGVIFLLSTFSIMTLIGQRDALIGQVNALAESSESSWTSNRELEALLAALQAGKNLKHPLIQVFQPNSNLYNQLHNRVLEILYKVIYQTNEFNRLEGHEQHINEIQFSPDGKYLVTASEDRTARLWDLQGEQKRELNHQYPVIMVRFSPKGKFIATVSQIDIIRLWDLEGNQLAEFQSQRDVSDIEFSLRGESIAIASRDGISLWNLQSDLAARKIVKLPYKSTNDFVKYVEFSPDGKLLVINDLDRDTIILWDLEKSKAIKSIEGDNVIFSPKENIIATSNNNIVSLRDLQGEELVQLSHQDLVEEIDFSPDGRFLATVSSEKIVQLWDLQERENLETQEPVVLTHTSKVEIVRFSSSSSLISTASNNGTVGTVYLWNLQGKQLDKFVHRDEVLDIDFSLDGRFIATAIGNGTTHFWNLKSQELKRLNHQDFEVKLSSDFQFLATMSWKRSVHLWKWENQELRELPHPENVMSIKFSPDGKLLATKSWDDIVRIWNLQGQKWQLKHQASVNKFEFSPDGKLLITASSDKVVRIWNLQDMDNLENQTPLKLHHPDDINDFRFSSDSKLLATTANDRKARVWNLHSPEFPKLELEHKNEVSEVRFSLDNQFLITIDGRRDDRTKVHLWNLENQEPQEDLLDLYLGYVAWLHLRFSPDSRFLAIVSSNSNDGFVHLWNLPDQKLLSKIPQQSFDTIENIRFSPNSNLFVAFTVSKTAQLWNLEGNKQAHLPHLDRVNDAQFSPDGSFVATASEDSMVYLWNLQGQKITQLQHQAAVKKVRFSQHGEFLFTVSDDGTVWQWQMGELDRILSMGCERISNYLKNNIRVKDNYPQLCDRTPSSNIFKRLTKLLR